MATTIPAAAPARKVQNVHIVSASGITKKIDQCLAILYPGSTPAPTTTDDLPAVSISARSATAAKAITTAEILKRRIAGKGGQWYQYTALSSIVVGGKEQPEQLQSKNTQRDQNKKNKERRKEESNNKKKIDGIEDDAEDGEDVEEDPYAILVEKVPPKKRKVPLLTIYISRSPILEFKKLYGEQSGGP